MILELAVFEYGSIPIAIGAGIKRIELCEEYTIGGISPSLDFFHKTREQYKGLIYVMVRPRGGDFVYSDPEFEIMLKQADEFRKAGADGLVSGFLQEDDSIEEQQLREFKSVCHPLPFTFHRAFDRAKDWKKAMDILIRSGCARVLSSGQAPSALQGVERLKEMIEYAGDQMLVLPGGGIRSENLHQLLSAIHTEEVHTAAILPSDVKENRYVANAVELRLLQTILIENKS